ncbi:hypothetical protein Cadr_000030233 [Camelus dromedarius]|uniref:Uncharacterized protein n=1 Tax=Camelus dromedarius TaxID=9838 RepID=A0A5N4BY32_CAMDR|nr:hypothetical protein Cadr_000030233 [Camelus dromedarius]
MTAEEVTVTEGHDPGEASQECSRQDQDRPGRGQVTGPGMDLGTRHREPPGRACQAPQQQRSQYRHDRTE